MPNPEFIPGKAAYQVLYNLSKKLTMVNSIQEIMEVTLETCLEIDAFDRGAIYLSGGESAGSGPLKSIGLSPEFITAIAPRVRDIMNEREPGTGGIIRRLDDAYLPSPGPSGQDGMKLALGISLRHEGRLNAFMVLCSRKTSGPGESSRGHLETIVEQVEAVLDRFKAKEALRDSEERLQHALDAANEGIWDLNFKTGKVFFSDKGFHLLEHSADESRKYAEPDDPPGFMTIGMLLEFINSEEAENIFHPDDRQIIAREYDRIQKTGRVAFEARFMSGGGKYKWIEMMAKSVTVDEHGTVVRSIGTFSDVTLRKEMERDRRKLELELINMEERTKLKISQSLHDDLGSHLSMIMLNFDTIMKKKRGAADCPENCVFMEGTLVENLRGMIKDAVSKCRKISSSLYPVNVVPGNMDHFVHRMNDMINLSHRPIEFVHDVDRSLAVRADKFTQLLYIAAESVTNAIKHSDCRRIALRLTRSGDNAVMTIADDGIGMDLDAVRSMDGCLGLKIMEYRASLMNWTIQIKSSEKDGTSITLAMERMFDERRHTAGRRGK